MSAGDAERRRIERDLHDGAQQRLVVLALDLRFAQRTHDIDPEVERVLEDAIEKLRDAVEGLRRLAHGVHQAIVGEAGLAAGLRSIADHARPLVTVNTAPDTRLPPDVEVAAYFVACEAVANAAKHANATSVTIDASHQGSTLTITVADDGDGGANPEGAGLHGLADRIEAQGGLLRSTSPVGGGTRLTAEIPCAS